LLQHEVDDTGWRLNNLLQDLAILELAISYKIGQAELPTDIFDVKERNAELEASRSDFEILLGNLLAKELEEEYQWLRKHHMHKGCNAAGSMATDPKALDTIMTKLRKAISRSEAQTVEIEKLSRRISSLQNLVRGVDCYRYRTILKINKKILHLGTREDNQVVRELAEITAQDSSSMKVSSTQNARDDIFFTKL
ncbi:hypothetical protein MMC18_009228, partial [Xylographa bjoerkii]|nr:hypothetical protein [Xylographa bjoerkii]